MAVKMLGVLLTTVQEELVAEIADKLCTLVLDSTKLDLHDVYTIGLTTLITKIPLHTRLIDGICLSSNSSFILVSCFELMTHLVLWFGTMPNVKQQHDAIFQISLLQLSSTETVVRKRAGSTIGVMSRVLSDALLHQLVDRLLHQIELAEGVGKSGKRRACANSTTTNPIADTCTILCAMCMFCNAEDAMSGASLGRMGITVLGVDMINLDNESEEKEKLLHNDDRNTSLSPPNNNESITKQTKINPPNAFK
eukprot:9590748-Ditylum_brightwellii.AAC.1